jgi:hypothetical protein
MVPDTFIACIESILQKFQNSPDTLTDEESGVFMRHPERIVGIVNARVEIGSPIPLQKCMPIRSNYSSTTRGEMLENTRMGLIRLSIKMMYRDEKCVAGGPWFIA